MVRRERSAAGLFGLLLGCLILLGVPARAAVLGANKVDLMSQFLNPLIPAGVEAQGYRVVRRAMAEKAIADARDAGLSFLRVGVTGFFPSGPGDRRNNLALWQVDPAAFWTAMDQMFDALDRSGIKLAPVFVWNLAQFPALGNDSTGTFVRDPNSASRRILARFVREFIGRYKSRRTILFYELTNEMNLLADLGARKNCGAGACLGESFTTADMIGFSRHLVGLIKSLDPSRPVSSGYAIPRQASWHLEHRPFAPAGPDWTPDTHQEFAQYLLEVHQPFDIVSAHIYPSPDNNRFGRPPGEQYKLAADVAAIAHSVGKPVFIGEFGDIEGATPFMAHMLDEIVRSHVDYAALWAWEFYQTSTYQTRDTSATRFNVEPGYSDPLIAMLIDAERRSGGGPPPPSPGAPPRVVLTWPLPCAVVDRPIDMTAVASAGAMRVKEVEFRVDGKPLATVTAPPYRAHFDPAGRGVRSAEIEARAAARSGAVATFRTPVRLNAASAGCRVPP